VPKILNALERHAGTTPQTAFIEPRVTFEGGSFPETTRTEILRTATEGALSTGRIQMILDELYASGKYADLSATITATGSPAEIMFSATPARSIERVEFNGNRLVASSQIEREIAPLKGGDGDAKLIGQSVERVLALYREDGYSLARVESLAVDRQNGTIRFHVDEGRIAQIRYEGNEKTRDYIIRREFPMDEGDVFSIAKASQGVVNIKSTGLFDYVLLDVRYVDNRPVVIIKVKEKSSELLRLGFHADDEHGVVSTIDLRDGNFRGAWEDLGVVLRYGYRDRGVRAEYTVNRIFHTYLTFNLGLYFKSRDIITYRDSPSEVNEHWDRIEDGRYRQINSGGTMTFGSNFKRLGDITAEIRWENDKIEGISGGGYTPELYRYVGLKFQSTIDTEDKFLFPTEGMALTMSYESALRNLGSDVGFGKIGVSYESYYSIFPRHTLRPRITFGFADQTLPIAEQYSLGGLNSFFGLREDDSRGRQVFLVNLEYRYEPPFRLIFDTYLKLRYDLGTISLVPEELKFNSFRHAVGVELALATPLGQVSFGMGKSFYSRRDLPNSPVTVGPLLLYFSVGPGL
jgi:outer membrane protein assembly factor BamA